MKPKFRFRRIALSSLGLLVTISLGIVFAHEGHAPLPSKGAEVNLSQGLIRLSPEARSALDVQSTEIGGLIKPDTVLAYATLVAPWKQHAFAVSRLPGRIVTLKIKPGDQVEAGQLLAEVQSQELESLQFEVQSAQTEQTLAEQVLKSLKDSVGAVAVQEITAAESQLQQARNAFELSKIKWLALGLSKERLASLLSGRSEGSPSLPITAPISGTVIHADLSVGKFVESGEHLFEVIDLSTVHAKIGVLEKDINRVKVGQQVEIELTAYPNEVFRGIISVVGQFLDPMTHLNDVWVAFGNPVETRPRLLPGMSGVAKIAMPPTTGTKTIPLTALVNDGVDRFVLIEEAVAKGISEYRKKSVVVVRETPEGVEVKSPDLFPGDRVVTVGGHELGVFFAPGILKLTPETASTIGLRIEPITQHSIESVIDLLGAVDLPPNRRSVVTARLSGSIASIRVDRGQKVNSGDVLAEVFSLDHLNLQLELMREHLTAELASKQLARLKEAKDSVSQRRLAEAESVAKTASHKRDSIRRRLEHAGLNREQLDGLVSKSLIVPTLPVRATVGGTVVSFDRVVGQAVRADEPLFEVHDLAKSWIEVFVTEKELARVRLGQTARIRFASDPKSVFTGKVTRSGQTFGNSHRTLSVWVELDEDSPPPLRHSQMARVTLVVESRPTTLAIPLGAIVEEGIRRFVFVRTGETFERREIILGRVDDRFAEIKSGLSLNEQVATTGAIELTTAWASVR